jgi:hypothetical protein
MKARSLEDAVSRYGEIINGVWKNEADWMCLTEMPRWFENQVINSFTKKGCSRIYLNRDIQQPLLDALYSIKKLGLDDELKTFNGCLNVRPVRGENVISTHAYGLALDFNALLNPMGSFHSSFSSDFVACFQKAGFAWGGCFHREIDCMHFSYAWE